MDDVIHLRIPPDMKKMAVHDAHRHEMNLSEYIRFCLEFNHELLRRQDEKKGK